MKCLGRVKGLGELGVCGNHKKWLQLRACKTWYKSVGKTPSYVFNLLLGLSASSPRGRAINLHCDVTVCPAGPEKSDFPPGCSWTTFRPILVLRDDISICPAALGRHFDLLCCSRTTFRPVLLPWDDISAWTTAQGRHFDSCSGTTTFELIARSCFRKC